MENSTALHLSITIAEEFFARYGKLFEYTLLITIILVLIIVYLMVFLVRRINLKKILAKRDAEKRIPALVAEHILTPYLEKIPAEDIQLPIAAFRKFIGKSRYRRTAFIYVLVDYIHLYTGNLGEVFLRIYNELELYESLEKDLKSQNVKKIILAIDELDFFRVRTKDILRRINELQHHKKALVREAANYYILQVTDADLHLFFTNLKHPLSEWERLQYFKLIITKEHSHLPHFYKWITPESEPSKILLCVDLCIYYYQVDATENIMGLLETDDLQLKCKLLNSLGRFYTSHHAAEVKDLYSNSSDLMSKMEILKALGRIGGVDQLHFLAEKFREEDNGLLKKHAAISAYKIDPEWTLEYFEAQPDTLESVVLAHITNSLLKY
ncbi:MAG: HEAT repeat domain-containing protein [Kaistella sp.]|nr:HEAT repeat domain-containing protein [Kaistella sp.]